MCRNSNNGDDSPQSQQPNDSSSPEQNLGADCATWHGSKRPDQSRERIWPEDAWREEGSQESTSPFCEWPYRLWQRWTFSYMRPLLSRRDHPILTLDDIFQAPSSLRSRNLSDLFWKFHAQQQTSQQEEQPQTLPRALWQIAKPTFIPAGICQLVSILCQVALPLFVRELLQEVERNPKQTLFQEGLPWACAMGIALIVYGIMNHRQRHLAAQTGMAIRATLLTVIYQRLFQLAPAGRAGLTQGQLTTLVAVDTQKLYDVAQEGHLIWALPLAISLVTIALVVVMGPVTLVGVGVLVINVPLVQRITASMLRIRSKRVKWTDARIESTNALLQGIQVTKLNHYEHHYETILGDAREQELHHLEREAAVWATTLSVSKLSAAMASAATFAVHTLSGNILTAATSFSVFLLFAALRFPINYAGRLMGKLAQAKSSLERLDEFLKRPTREQKCLHTHDRETKTSNDHTTEGKGHFKPLVIEKGSFSVGSTIHSTATASPNSSMHSLPSIAEETGDSKRVTAFTVSGVNFTVERGQTLAIVGPVGSGKSTIINGLLEEVPKSEETFIQAEGTIALAPQTPFILNATVRDNILLGRPFHAEHYQEVLEACCLRQDLQSLGEGDMTEIGERGVTLSGGQKQRVSLARLAYGRPEIALLDDPLSALDAGTAKRVFQNLFEGQLLSKSACILVTHASHFLNRVDNILVIVDGRARFLGSWAELLTFNESDDSKTIEAIDHLRASVQEEENGDSSSGSTTQSGPNESDQEEEETSKDKIALMTTEEREHGLSSFQTWLLWFKHAGGVPFFVLLVFLLTADRLAYFGQEYWVAIWTQGADEPVTAFGIDFPPQTDGLSAQYKYLTAYSVILFSALAANLARSEWSVTGGSRAARNVYAAMLKRVLRAPMSYFETTPIGRLLNRFTYDMEIVDFVLTQNMSLFLVATSSYISGAIVMIGILPWVAVILVPTTILYCFLLWQYRKSGIDLQRLDAMSRSPIQAMVTEAMDGYTTIRIFGTEPVFLGKFFSSVDRNTAAMLNFVSAQRWLGTRIEMMGAFIVFMPSFLVCCLNDILGLSSGLVGLLVTGSMNFTLALSFLVDFFGDAEASITAIERVDAMAEVPQEAQWETDVNSKLLSSWPEYGEIVFENVQMRYRPDLPLALNGLSFQCPATKRIAVCGRTGAGKSSLTVALFRLVEIESGRILLDGVDLSQIGLADVRGRKHGMTIIPQHPFLTGRTVRECLDPLQEATDEEIESAITDVSLSLLPDSPIEEGGSNLSVGERQLLNLASALLSKPKVLVLDEATASVDGATDALIQNMLRTRFQNTTLLTIAHRLNTIMDYDYVLVMDAGKAAEFGSPADLLAIGDGGIFTELVDATGPESSKALKEIAYQQSDAEGSQ